MSLNIRHLLVVGLVVIAAPFFEPSFVFSEEVSDETPEQSEETSVSASEPTERLLMGGTEIQGTIEKPHVVYIVPWKENVAPKQQELTLERSFREEILAPVDYDRFQRKWGEAPRKPKGGDQK